MPSANGSNGNGSNGHNGNGTNGANGHAHETALLPRTFDREKITEAFGMIASGETLAHACKTVGLNERSLKSWILENTGGIYPAYARARELRVMGMADEIIAIADDSRGDTTTRRDSQGNEYEVPDNEWIARSKLRVDTRRWIMSKVSPKEYGDKVDTNLNIGGTGKAIVVEINPFKGHRQLMAGRVDSVEVVNVDGVDSVDGNGHGD